MLIRFYCSAAQLEVPSENGGKPLSHFEQIKPKQTKSSNTHSLLPCSAERSQL
jgi:hypothetical protein